MTPQPTEQVSDVRRSTRRTGERLPSLDGWRAVSILLVLGAHSTVIDGFPQWLVPPFRWLFDGDVGVRVFFLISGFLITWLMLQECEKNGRMDLRRFYIRRALRILPVYVAFLLVLACLQLLTVYRQSRGTWIANATFTTNFLELSSWTSGHLWSVAVEEQFYLLWPGLFVALSLERDLSRGFRVLGVVILMAPVWRVLTWANAYRRTLSVLFAKYSFLSYCDSIALGCLAALVLFTQREFLETLFIRWPKLIVSLGLFVFAVPYVLHRRLVGGAFTIPFAYTFQALGIVTFLIHSILFPRLIMYRILNYRLVRYIGTLSYSIYIWQQMFCSPPSRFGWPQTWWMSFPGWLITVFAVAMLSFHCLERPLFQLRARFR